MEGRFFLKVKVAQLCLTLCNPMDYRVHGFLQARILKWVTCFLLQGIFPTQGCFFQHILQYPVHFLRTDFYLCWRRRDEDSGYSSKSTCRLLWWLSSKESAFNAGDTGSIPGSDRSPEEGNGNPLQYSCLENPMGRRAWQATVHGMAKELNMT